MIELVFMACAATACSEQHLTFAEQPAVITAFQCAFTGQVELAKWVSEHRNWRVVGGFKCRPAGVVARI